MEILKLLIEQLNSSVVILLLAMAAILVLTYKVGKWSEKFDTHKERIGNLEDMKDNVTKMGVKVDLIYQNTNPNPLIQASSPITLTEAGKQIVEQISAQRIFDHNAARLVSMVEKETPGNAYDIQQASFSVAKNELIKMLLEDDLVNVKRVAFDRGLQLEDVMSVFGIFLRNRILTDKGIPLSEVDDHNTQTG